ncbi:CLUMA_CG001628, isoform B [Clunio marinus]|uniref:CLUMA_CG001628, isoform B n=1 Tax=Clunio marinus TaxID=568069 RepID=A0A1J1HNN5_9DIPT|nr:CLUMA_CG001628, isoform B [Clunio marinus]
MIRKCGNLVSVIFQLNEAVTIDFVASKAVNAEDSLNIYLESCNKDFNTDFLLKMLTVDD